MAWEPFVEEDPEAAPQAPDPTGGDDPAYIAKMIAKAEGRSVEEAPAEEPKAGEQPAEEPALLAGKFKTPADLEAAYKALEAKLGQPKEAPKAPEGEAPKEGEEAPKAPAKATPEAQAAAMTDLVQRYTANGALTDEDYAKITEVFGIEDRAVVDNYVAGQVALAQVARQAVFTAVGGEENYTAITTWARANLPAEDIAAYNAVAQGNDLAALKLAAAGLKARHDAANGSPPQRRLGGGSVPEAGVFTGWDQVKLAMKDPRYDRDSGFRAQVAAKLSRSNI